jgi:long-subunit acyl-CoA synthetase (AMP-forming)
MFAMTSSDWSGVPEDVAAVRSAIEDEIAGSTLLTVYAETVAQAPDVVAHKWLADGEWRSLTYQQVYERVGYATLGLAALGFRPGESAALWSRNRSEATVADYAVMHARGVPVFIYPTIAAEQAADIIAHCEATVVIVEPEFLPVLNSIRAKLPQLRALVILGPTAESAAAESAAAESAETQVLSWQALLDLGRAEANRDPAAFERSWRQVTPGNLATLIYTSGTTGHPKGVMITHHNVRSEQAASELVNPHATIVPEDGVGVIVSYLPMAHVTGRTLDHWGPMTHPSTLAYCPNQLKIFEIAAQSHPTFMMGIPRVWEKLHAALRSALPDVAPAAVRALPDAVKQAVLIKIGLDRCRLAATGSAPIDPEIVAFFRALGVPLSEGWGMSELSNAATFAAPEAARTGAVGQPLPGVEIRLADDGEVLVRGPIVMAGYYKDLELTMATIDADGWLHTGDIGEFDADGFLKIIDRKKELIITSGGKNISPALVEYELQRHPLIGQACAIGDRRNYVTALLVLDPETTPAWARAHGIEFGSLADLAADPEVRAEVERGVAEANSHLARPEHVRRFVLLPAEWTTQSGELTPSMKRRRRVITDRYAKEIEELYA